MGHGYMTCPTRPYRICGQQGHKTWECPKQRKPQAKGQKCWEQRNQDGKHVLVVGPGEDAVAIQVKIGTRFVSALLDTGARPSVIDNVGYSTSTLKKTWFKPLQRFTHCVMRQLRC